MLDLDRLLDLAVTAARGAGALLMEGRHGQPVGLGTKTSATDMVSEMDRSAEAQIVQEIRRARPDDAILAEEGAQHDGTTGVRWIVDPLDGTTNYLYGQPSFGVSIAVEVAGEVVVGVVADPGRDELFSAVRGRGARRNAEVIEASAPASLATALVGTGFPYDAAGRVRQAELLRGVIGSVRDIRRVGAASLDLCWVACGRLDGYYEAALQLWDVAAGILIAREAGAVVTGLDGGPPSPAYVVAAAPGISEALRRLLVGAGATPLTSG